METFDFMSQYKVLSEGYCDPPVWATYGSDDEPEYVVERGYEIRHNGSLFKVWDWTFIQQKCGKLKNTIPTVDIKINGISKAISKRLTWLWPRSRNSLNKDVNE